MAKHYTETKLREELFDPEYPHVFYNGVKGLNLQSMVIMASIDFSDTSIDIKKKIKMVSFFLDYFSVVRVLR